MAVVNLATVANGASASASQQGSGHEASYAIDGNDSTYWQNNMQGVGSWLAIDLGQARVIRKYRVNQYVGVGASDWRLEYSPDNSNWRVLLRSTTTGDSGQVTLAANISARYWRIRSFALQANPYWDVYTFELHGDAGDTPNVSPNINLATAGNGASATASSTPDPTNKPASKAIDGDDTTWWYGSGAPNWLRVDLGQSRTIESCRAYQYATLGSSSWKLQYCDDDATWADALSSTATDDSCDVALSSPLSGRYWRFLQVTPQTPTVECLYTLELWGDPNPAPPSSGRKYGPAAQMM